MSLLPAASSHSAEIQKAYPGREADAAWRSQARQRIAQHRQGEMTVQVFDANGQPAPNVPVRVEQTRHAFGFGTAVGCYAFQRADEKGESYRRLIKDVFRFNEIVFENDMKPTIWRAYATGEDPKRRWENVQATLDHFNQQQIPVRGHFLLHGMLRYGSPRWGVNDLADFDRDPRALEERLVAEAAERAAFIGDRVVEWDALNHVVGWGRDINWINRTGDPAYGVNMLKAMRRAVPETVALYLNEGHILSNRGRRADRYFEAAKALLDAGAPLDGVGFMGHFAVHEETGDVGRLTPPAMQYDIIDRFAALGLKLKITELDVDAGDDDQLQADFLRDTMIAAFSHPAMESIVMWGFWEGKHWRKRAALARRDGSMKPAGEAWIDLVYNQWWTDQTVMTDDHGMVLLPAFYGRYNVSAVVDGQPVKVSITHTAQEPASAQLRPGS